MKLIHSTIKIAVLSFLLFSFYNCADKVKGTFYISDKAKKYVIDSTITSINFIDNYGISESFSLDQNNIPIHYFSEWGIDGDALGETYSLSYTSLVNRFSFEYHLRADVDYTSLEIGWGDKDRTQINIKTEQFEYLVEAEIHFFDSLEVNGITYQNIIELDYSNNLDAINDNTPVKTFVSGNKGLLKFIRKDGVIFERVE